MTHLQPFCLLSTWHPREPQGRLTVGQNSGCQPDSGVHAVCAHVFLHVHGHSVYTCVCMCVLHVHTACAHTCMHVRARIVFCVYVCVLTSWTLPGSARVLKPTRPSARRPGAPRSCSSVCSASEFRAVKTLAGSSRKLCLCGNEVPSAPQPSYWLIDDMIPRGSPVIPGNTLPRPLPPPHWGLVSTERRALHVRRRPWRSQHSASQQPGLSLTWILQLCVPEG